jgi:hypothetical protein
VGGQVLDHHSLGGPVLEKQENLCADFFKNTLVVEGQKGQSEEESHQDEDHDFGQQAQVH